ncbi:MAG: ceramidase domain-containing protein [Planctomycetota bacterium]|jgi:hypothetical protein
MRSDRNVRIPALAVGAMGLLGVILLWSNGPITQDPAYHAFADERTLLGTPNFWNVWTNLPFVLAGCLGLGWMARDRNNARGVRAPIAVFFVGMLLTGFGSAYYHWAPTTETLFWDRLPLTLAFMSLAALAVQDRLGDRAGRMALVPLLILGPGTILWWRLTGDLRWYAMVQFFPMLAIPVLLATCPGLRFRSGHWWAVAALYAGAKAAELGDHDVHLALGFSGHAAKHLLAAGVPYVVWRMARRPRSAEAIERSGAPALAPPGAAVRA